MIDYEEVVEAIWRYDCPRIDIDEDITTLYADGKPFAQVIHRADGSREDLYFDDYEIQKDTLIKPNATLRDVVELCMNGDIKQLAHLGYIMVAQRGNGKSLRQLEIIDSLMKRRTNYENR